VAYRVVVILVADGVSTFTPGGVSGLAAIPGTLLGDDELQAKQAAGGVEARRALTGECTAREPAAVHRSLGLTV